MKLGVVVWFFVLFPALVLAGGAEEEDLECFNREDLESVPYNGLAEKVDELFVSGIDKVVICMSNVEEGGTITVAEIQVVPTTDKPAEPLPDEGILSLGSFIRIHQELHGIFGVQLSPYSPIQLINIPTGFSTIDSILEHVSWIPK